MIMARVLIVDDSEFMRAALRAILRAEGYEVLEASNGAEAIDFYRRERPDLVTMDITMPEVDGLEAAQAILKEFSDAKIVMCSALGQEKIVRRAVDHGILDFITKPFKSDRVRAALERILKN